jgi:hypothetical protein
MGAGVGVACGAMPVPSLQRGLRGGQRRRVEGIGGTAFGSWRSWLRASSRSGSPAASTCGPVATGAAALPTLRPALADMGSSAWASSVREISRRISRARRTEVMGRIPDNSLAKAVAIDSDVRLATVEKCRRLACNLGREAPSQEANLGRRAEEYADGCGLSTKLFQQQQVPPAQMQDLASAATNAALALRLLAMIRASSCTRTGP